MSKSSYSTVEATQIAYLTDTVAPILEKIELELKCKLFFEREKSYWEIKFDTQGLLRADKVAQANYLRTLVNCGVMTPNEVRDTIDLDPIMGGDDVYIMTNMAAIGKSDKTGG